MIRESILPIDFIGKGEVKGFQLHQMIRGKQSCIYKVTSSCETHYEVFKIKIGFIPKTREPYECYPKANSFGIWAWTYRDYERAVEKFNKIEKL